MTPFVPPYRRPSWHFIWVNALLLLGVALDLFLFSDIAAPVVPGSVGPHSDPWLLVACAAFGYIFLFFRRGAGPAVLLILCVYSAVSTILLSYSPIVAVLIALTSVVAHRPAWWGSIGVLAVVLTSTTWVYAENRNNNWAFTVSMILAVQVGYLVIIAVAAGIGWWIQINERQSEQRQIEAAKSAVIAERQSVARELHDIVAHAVTLMVLQASGARAVMSVDPARASDALDVVEKTGTQAMAELRRLLKVLRTEEDGRSDDDVGLPRGIDALPQLVRAVTTAGVRVSIITEGEPHPVDKSVDATAYRIVSESLTNVTKHSGVGATAEVHVRWTPACLDILVTDDGRGAGPNQRLSTGNGLTGLTERVVLIGGSFAARPRASGGYEVHASLPLPADSVIDTPAFQAP